VLWPAPEDKVQSIRAAFEAVPTIYIADGHHRSAAASRVHANRSNEDSAYFLAGLYPDDQLQVLAYNRVVHDLADNSPAAFLERLRRVMTVAAGGPPSPDHKGSFSMYLGGEWFRVEAPREAVEIDHPVDSLDAAILQERVLGPILGIEDPRTSTRIDFVGGIRGTDELEKRVRDNRGGVAFSVFPVSVAELMAVADAGLVLPPKSTWFEPKLRSGLLIHEF